MYQKQLDEWRGHEEGSFTTHRSPFQLVKRRHARQRKAVTAVLVVAGLIIIAIAIRLGVLCTHTAVC